MTASVSCRNPLCALEACSSRNWAQGTSDRGGRIKLAGAPVGWREEGSIFQPHAQTLHISLASNLRGTDSAQLSTPYEPNMTRTRRFSHPSGPHPLDTRLGQNRCGAGAASRAKAGGLSPGRTEARAATFGVVARRAFARRGFSTTAAAPSSRRGRAADAFARRAPAHIGYLSATGVTRDGSPGIYSTPRETRWRAARLCQPLRR